LDKDKQHRLVGWLLRDRSLYLQVSKFLEPSFFTDPQCRKTLEYVKSFIKEHNSLPTNTILETELGFDPLEQFKTDEATDVEKDYIISSMNDFYKHGMMRSLLSDGISMLEKGDIDYATLDKKIKEIASASVDIDLGLNFFKDIMGRLEYLEDSKNIIPTGYGCMDDILGGWEKKELHLIGGRTGGGKSIFLTNFSAKNVLAGLNVLTVTLELSEEVFASRYDSIILNKSKDMVIAEKSKSAKYLTAIHEATGGSLTLKYYPSTSLNTHMLEAYIEQYFISNGFYPDIIYIDYLSLMRSNEKISVSDVYILEKYVAEEIRGLSGELNVPIVSATQLNREGMNAATPDVASVAGGISKIHAVGYFGTICQTPAEKQLGLIKLWQAKVRNAKDGWWSKFKINYTTLGLEDLGTIQNMEEESNDYEGIK